MFNIKRIKRTIFSILLMGICQLSTAYYVQLEQITTKQGLVFPNVTAMDYFPNGRLWVGTTSGFSVFTNGSIKSFKEYHVNDSVKTLIGTISDIKCLSNERTLVAAANAIYDCIVSNISAAPLKYNGKNLVTSSITVVDSLAYFYYQPENSLMSYKYTTGEIRLVYQFPLSTKFKFEKILYCNDNNCLYLMNSDKGIYSYNIASQLFLNINQIDYKFYPKATIIDSQNNMWVAKQGGGIFCYSIDSGFLLLESYKVDGSDHPGKIVTSMLELPNGDIDVGTNGDGIHIIHRKTDEIVKKRNDLFDEVNCMCLIDDDVFMGTSFNGLIIARRSFYFTLDENSLNHPSLSNMIALSMYDEENGNIWIGTGGQGIIKYNEIEDKTNLYPSTDNLNIGSIYKYDKDRLLLGTYEYNYLLFNKNTGEIDYSFMKIFDKCPLNVENADSVIIVPDNKGNMLVFNCLGKNFKYNPNTGDILYFSICKKQNEEMSESIRNVVVEKDYCLVYTKNSLYRIDFDNFIPKYIESSASDISGLTIDKKNIIWFTNEDALFRYDQQTDSSTIVMKSVLNYPFVSVTTDNNGIIWLTSSLGYIYRYNEALKMFTIYTKEDGITEGNFLRTFAHFSSKGKLYFPGVDGLLILDTKEMHVRRHKSERVTLKSLCIDDKYLPLSDSSNLVLNHNYKSFEVGLYIYSDDPTIPIDFEINLERNGKVISSYNTNKTIYRNDMLREGRYRLLVKSIDITGWSPEYQILEFRVKPPFFFTIQFNLILIIFVGLIIFQIFQSKYKHKQQDLDKQYAENLNKQKEERISFITNIAHDLRTPLSLVYNPLKDLISEKNYKGADEEIVERMFHQLNKMKKMIDMVLDSSNTNSMSISDRMESTDLNDWISKLLDQFYLDCERKGLTLRYNSSPDLNIVTIDKDILEIAINNLITNAIKYSDTGTITVSLSSTEDDLIKISVSDQGRGFKCNPEELFVRFFRESKDKPGFGLGLNFALTQMKKIGGNITAEHNNDVGSIFTITFPKNPVSDTSLSEYY